MIKLSGVLANIIQFLKRYSVTKLLPNDFPIPYQILPETRDFTLYEMVWWRSEKWYIKSFQYSCYGDGKVRWLELENYPCKLSSHNVQYVDSREVKKIRRSYND